MTFLDVRAVTKVFGTPPNATQTLDGVDLRVEQGKITSVIGPSGCGKSTLLRTLGGLVAPSAGTISIGEHSPSAARAAHLAGPDR